MENPKLARNTIIGITILAVTSILLLTVMAGKTKITNAPPSEHPEDIRVNAYIRCLESLSFIQQGTTATTHCFELSQKAK